MEIALDLNIPQIALFTGGGPRIVGEELLAATEFAVNLAQATIVPLTPVDRGLLRGGTQTQILGQGADVLGRVFNTMEYAPAVELGSRPHFPPVAALEAWARRKLGQDGLGFVIARAISRRGTKGVFMFKRGLEACRSRIEARFDQVRDRVIERLGA